MARLHHDPNGHAGPNGTGRADRPLTVLLADDMALVLLQLRDELARLGLSALLACDGDEAIETYRAQHGRIDLVVLQSRLPGAAGGGGAAALEAMRRINPAVPCCFLAEWSSADERLGWARAGALRVFYKPLHFATVAVVIRYLLRTGR